METESKIDIVILALLPLVFFYPVLFGAQTFFQMDMAYEEIPNHLWLKGHWPGLWNPLLFTGLPHYANPQAYTFDLLHLISLPLPGIWGFNFFIVSHFWVASFGVFALSRQFAVSVPAAVFSAIAFTYGGFFISLGHLPIMLNSTTYMPWVLLAFKKLVDKPGWPHKSVWMLMTGIASALLWLGGEPQITVLTFGFCAFLPLTAPKGASIRDLYYLVGAGIVGVFLAMVQILPFWEFLSFSNRTQGLSFEAATKWSMEPGTLLSLFIPHGFVSAESSIGWGYGFWEKQGPYIFSIHLGITTLLLAWAAMRTPSRGRLVFLFLCVLGIGLALGRHSTLYRWLFQMPVFSQFRFPEKFFLLSHLSICLLAAFGFDRIVAGGRLSVRFQLVGVGFFAVALAGWMSAAHIVLGPAGPGPSFQAIFLKEKITLGLGFGLVAFVLCAGSAAARIKSFGLIGLLAVELFVAHVDVNQTLDANRLLRPPPAARWLLGQGTTATGAAPRILAFDPPGINRSRRKDQPSSVTLALIERLVDPISMQFGINDIRAGYSLRHRGASRFQEFLSAEGIKALRFFGVQYTVSPYPLASDQMDLVHVTPGASPVYIYRVPETRPRCYVVQDWNFVADDAEWVSILSGSDFDPAVHAVVSGKGRTGPLPDQGPSMAPGLVGKIERSSRRADLEVQSPVRSLVVFLETMYPGWQVSVDGQPASLERVNGGFMGVFVSAGHHQVRFHFSPWRWQAGAAATLLGLILALTGVVIMAKRAKPRPQNDPGVK
ncbi:MAG: YfhO family protein [Pseudomonadota bacterium]